MVWRWGAGCGGRGGGLTPGLTSADKSIMVFVCRSSPVTMLPTVRRAGVCTDGELCISSSTSRRHTPASITAWIFSFGLSDRYWGWWWGFGEGIKAAMVLESAAGV